jgi:hypothetical protein
MGDRMRDRPAVLGIQVELGPDADAAEIALATERLRRELLELDIDAVVPATGEEPPPGTRAGGGVELGALIVTAVSSGLFTMIVEVAREWLAGQRERSITLHIDGDVLELTGLSSGEQSRLTDRWLARHADP